MKLVILRALLRLLALVSPRLAAHRLYRLWFVTHRFAEPVREARWRHQGTAFTVAGQNGPLGLYRWGQGPCVLLLHGWNGRGKQMGGFAVPLVKAGYCAVALVRANYARC